MWAEKKAVRSQFSHLMKRATKLDDITSRQISTNPSYQDLLDILSLRSESVQVDGELNYFLNYDKRCTN